jgi:hypothetical protein
MSNFVVPYIIVAYIKSKKMEKQEYKKLLENALSFHKVNKDKKAIERVTNLLEGLNDEKTKLI